MSNNNYIETLKFNISDDFRCFKKGQEIDINLIKNGVNYIVGPNGSGKTTLMHAIRAERHDLAEYNKDLFDGMSNMEDSIMTSSGITIEGLDKFDQIFVLDSVDDDPLSFTNSATASGYICGGGWEMAHLSKGQKALAMQSKFIKSLQNITKFSIADYKAGKKYDKHPLIIVDEVDEGLDIKMQSKFDIIVSNLATTYNATLICICHNFMCPACSLAGSLTTVFDLSDFKQKTIGEYVEQQTGFTISISPTKK